MKKYSLQSIIFEILCLLVLNSCTEVFNFIAEDLSTPEEDLQRVYMHNQTGESVYLLAKEIPDSASAMTIKQLIADGRKINVVPVNGAYNDIYYNKPLREQKLPLVQYTILKSSTVDRYGIESLEERNYCDTMYIYNNNQLKAMNYNIVYTGK